MDKNKNNGTGIMFGAIILMVVIFAIILVVFFVNGAKNGSRIGQVYSNSLQENAANEDTNEIDANNTNNVEYVSLNNGLDQGNSVDMPINADNAKKFDKSYIGKYTWKDGDNSISFELSEENGETKYRLLYYPNEVAHASEELWGDWSTSLNIVLVDNENEDAIATYSFNDITYNENKSISISIQVRDVINKQLEMYKIPDGKYTFKKAN